MSLYSCPYCLITSNRRYNIVRHIYRKHPDNNIPESMLPLAKNGRYSCPYCLTTSNRKYNMKEHINRKHFGEKIPNNLNSSQKNFTNSSLSAVTARTAFPYWRNSQNLIQNLPPIIMNIPNKKKKNRNNSLFKTFMDFLLYQNIIQNERLLQKPHFYQHNNLNLNSYNWYYEPLSNIDYGEPFLFKIYKCPVCFKDSPTMTNSFDSIKASNEYRYCLYCNLRPIINEDNKITIDPKIKEFAIQKIFSIIDNKKDPNLELCLKSIKIPTDFQTQINFDSSQNNNNNKNDNENSNQINFPSWLQKLLLYEEFIDLENTEKNNWANRLMTTNNNSTEITREELLRLINLSNSTFGLFKFQKANDIIHHFFTYLQLEKGI
jgi:hypothetical protein